MKKILITEKQLENLKLNSDTLTEEVKRFRKMSGLNEQDNSNPWKSGDYHDINTGNNGFQGTGFENQDNQGNQPIYNNNGEWDELSNIQNNETFSREDLKMILDKLENSVYDVDIRKILDLKQFLNLDDEQQLPPQEQQVPPEGGEAQQQGFQDY